MHRGRCPERRGFRRRVDANIENAADIFDFQLDLNFDPTILQAGGALEGTFLSGDGTTFFIPGVVDNTAGSITFNADTLPSAISGVDGGGMLLQFDFNALAPGTSSLTVENLILQNSLGDLVDASIANSSVTVGTATVPTPESSSFILLALGVVLCAVPPLLRRGARRFPGATSQLRIP